MLVIQYKQRFVMWHIKTYRHGFIEIMFIYELILVTCMLPSSVKTITSSISEHSSTNSSFLKVVPIKPSDLFIYNLELRTTTFLTSTSSKILISVFLSLPSSYFVLRCLPLSCSALLLVTVLYFAWLGSQLTSMGSQLTSIGSQLT